MSARPPVRRDGYAPLRSYAVIGDGRTVALVAGDGAIDWLCWPDLDSPSVFAALLDPDLGGSFTLAPTGPFRSERRYVDGTNVLETTFETDSGQVRVVDALTFRGDALGPTRELQRRVHGDRGRVPMTWRVWPRFGYSRRDTRVSRRGAVAVATSGSDALAILGPSVGSTHIGTTTVHGAFEIAAGESVQITLCGAHQEPLIFPTSEELDDRFDHTLTSWRAWTATRTLPSRWRGAVERSALALKLLVFAPSGAVAAAATTSLPEEAGGQRNWDYRFSWIRDSAFTLSALLRLGCAPEAQAYLWWLVQATQLTHPRLQPLYRLYGGPGGAEKVLPMPGYAASTPVRIGNAAARQHQLDSYGELLHTVWLYAQAGGRLDREIGRRLADIADLLCRTWRKPDAGIWEIRSEPTRFTHSAMMCWVGLTRAGDLADCGLVPAGDRHRARWRMEASACRDFIERRCFSDPRRSYTRYADGAELDASVLLGLLLGYGNAHSARWVSTVETLRRELGHGPFIYRYTGEDGLAGSEGAFISCSFWLAESLARTGRLTDATALMDQLIELSNDVGLYAEEIDPETGAFLGNLPQGLSHLALISAATAIAEECAR